MKALELPIESISVGTRHRKDLGDIAGLARSITAVGLLHPVVVTADLLLVAGARRLAACRSLGWVTVPACIVDNLTEARDLLRAEAAENRERKQLTPSEGWNLAETLRPLEEKEATERQGARTDLQPCANLAPGKTRDKVAEPTGMGHTTLAKTGVVVQAAEADPETFSALVDEMDRTGKVDRAYREVKRAETRREAAEFAAALPTSSDRCALVLGDFRERMEELEDNSVALIFTDPPYDEGSIPLYADLAEIAARKLVPGGSLIAYVGHYALPEILAGMGEHLRYWWIIAAKHSGGSARLPGKWVFVEWKPLVWFVNGGRRDNQYVADMIVCDPSGPESEHKAYHDWQQDLKPARYCIDLLTQPGELVVEPFLGSGTTLLAALEAGRRGWGCEVDETTLAIARGRINGSIAG